MAACKEITEEGPTLFHAAIELRERERLPLPAAYDYVFRPR